MISIGTHEQNKALLDAIKDLKSKGEIKPNIDLIHLSIWSCPLGFRGSSSFQSMLSIMLMAFMYIRGIWKGPL